MLTGEAIIAAMLLCAANRPDAGGHRLDTRKKAGHPVLLDDFRIALDAGGYSGAIDRHGNVANTKQDSAGLKLVDANVNASQTGHGIVSRHGLPEWISDGRRLGFGIVYFEDFAEFVFGPDPVFKGVGDAFMPQDDDDIRFFFGCTGRRVGQEENLRPGKRQDVMRARDIDDHPVFAFQLTEPGVGVRRVMVRGNRVGGGDRGDLQGAPQKRQGCCCRRHVFEEGATAGETGGMWHRSFLHKIMPSGRGCQWHVDGVSDDAIAECFGHSFPAAINMEFGIDIADMAPNGIEADMAMAGDHLVAVSFYKIGKHFFFPVGEMIF